MEEILEILQTVLGFVREYKIWILIGLVILFIDRIVSFLNALFTLSGNFARLIGKTFRFVKAKLLFLIQKVAYLISYPVRAYRRHALKRSDFYVVPD